MSDSLQLHGLQCIRLSCPLLSLRICSNSYPLSWWCHPTISSSAILISFCLQSLPESETFPMSQLFKSGSQSTGAPASASALPMNIQGLFPLALTGFIPLLSKGFLRRIFSSSSAQKHQFFGAQPLYDPILTYVHDSWRNHSFDCMDLCQQRDVSAF